MYCHLTPPDAILLVTYICKMFLEPRDTSDLISMVSFTFTPAPFTSSCLAKFGWVPFAVCNALLQSTTQNLRSKISGAVSIRLWTRVHEIFRPRRRPFVYFPTPLPIVYVTFHSEDIRL